MMKTIGSLAIVGLAVTAMFFACSDRRSDSIIDSNDSSPPALRSGYQNPYEEAGVIHNQALTFFLDTYDPETATYNTVLDAMEEFGLGMGLTEEVIDMTVNTTHEWYSTIGALIQLPGGGFDIDIDALGNFSQNLLTELESGTITQDIYDEVEPIVTATVSGVPLSEIEDMVGSLNLAGYDPDEMGGVLAFESVYRHSSQFWQNHFSQTVGIPAISISRIILIDAISALTFYGRVKKDVIRQILWSELTLLQRLKVLGKGSAITSLVYALKLLGVKVKVK